MTGPSTSWWSTAERWIWRGRSPLPAGGSGRSWRLTSPRALNRCGAVPGTTSAVLGAVRPEALQGALASSATIAAGATGPWPTIEVHRILASAPDAYELIQHPPVNERTGRSEWSGDAPTRAAGWANSSARSATRRDESYCITPEVCIMMTTHDDETARLAIQSWMWGAVP
ncbi:DUF6192 family protein [Streptomyces sp. NPDC050619]|uniref:DUF6192 family protein n=1 Tax=Streptomyces sp. NPDC050619 TaxID=3157214 RepID=UPI003419A8A1